MGRGCENVRQGEECKFLKEREREGKGRESMKIEGSRDETVGRDGRGRREKHSALCF